MNSAMIASSDRADAILFFHSWIIAVSTEAKKRVPVLIPCAPKSNVSANPRPSAIPPAANYWYAFPNLVNYLWNKRKCAYIGAKTTGFTSLSYQSVNS